MKKVHINYLLDAVIALAFLISTATGLAFMAMGSGGYQGGRNAAFATSLLGIAREQWSDLHLVTSLVMITGVGMHLILHWKWITCVTGQILGLLPLRRSKECDIQGETGLVRAPQS
jgi:hypothetical protein